MSVFDTINTPWKQLMSVERGGVEHHYESYRIRPLNGEWLLYNSARAYSYMFFGTLKSCLECFDNGEFVERDSALDDKESSKVNKKTK